MCTNLLGEPRQRQSQIVSSPPTAKMDNGSTDDQTTTEEQSTTNNDQKFFVLYTNEKRFRILKGDMYGVYENVFPDTPTMYTRMVVGT